MRYGTFIAVEGAIGSGKTSLAQILAGELEADLALEQPHQNRFLPDFYRQPRRFALQTQLAFLLDRHRQQVELQQRSLFHAALVADYIFEKDQIFAHLNLDERELELYYKIADALAGDSLTPDLAIYLQSSPERLLTNIKIRNIEYEQSIELDYIRELCEAYAKFFIAWNRSPLLIVNVTTLDFVHNVRHRSQLVERIRSMPPGTTFFNPEN